MWCMYVMFAGCFLTLWDVDVAVVSDCVGAFIKKKVHTLPNAIIRNERFFPLIDPEFKKDLILHIFCSLRRFALREPIA